MNNKYKIVLCTVLILNILMVILTHVLSITLLIDGWRYMLWIVLPVTLVCYPSKRNNRLILVRTFIVLATLLVSGCLFLTGIWKDSNYGYMKSPKGHHEVILKKYSLGFPQPTASLEVYEKIGILFKKDTGERIRVHDYPILLGNGTKFEGKQRYEIDYNLILEWIDEDTLVIYLKGIDASVRGDRTLASIKFVNK